MRNRLILLALAVAALTAGCSNANYQRSFGMNGHDFIVTCYSGNGVVKTYTTSGKVQSEDGSDGWFFQDAATGKVVIVSGGLITIERKD